MIFTYISWTSICKISLHYFYNQKTSMSLFLFGQRRNNLVYYGSEYLTLSHSGSFSHEVTCGALDKEISFNRPTFKCDPRKEMVRLKAMKVSGGIFSWKR